MRISLYIPLCYDVATTIKHFGQEFVLTLMTSLILNTKRDLEIYLHIENWFFTPTLILIISHWAKELFMRTECSVYISGSDHSGY